MSVFESEMRNILKAGLYNWPVYEKTAPANYFIASSEDKYTLEIPMVGILKENLTVDVQEGILTVIAKSDKKVTQYANDFRQSWHLAKDVDVDNLTAKLENGLLTVIVPRVKPLKKVINIAIS